MLAPDLSIVRAASNGGPIYDVPNPFCRFSLRIEF
jgi:hypothetical protein